MKYNIVSRIRNRVTKLQNTKKIKHSRTGKIKGEIRSYRDSSQGK